VPEVARELGYTTRTLYRDLVVLERVGVPIYQERVGNAARWRVVEGYRRRLSLTLSWSEVLALTAGRSLLAGLSGSMFHESAVSGLAKIRRALPEALAARADAAGALLSASSGAAHDYTQRDEIVQRLIEAIERRETVELKYRKPGGSVERRRVDPLHLHIQAGAIYVIGHSHERHEIRTFLVDRVTEVTPTNRRFERKDPFASRDFLQGAFGPWTGKSAQVRLRFSPAAAPFVAEKRMHQSQTTQWSSDGGLDVRFLLPISPPLVAWILGFGPRVKVLSPQTLADVVHREHSAAIRNDLPPRSQKSIRAVTVPDRVSS